MSQAQKKKFNGLRYVNKRQQSKPVVPRPQNNKGNVAMNKVLKQIDEKIPRLQNKPKYVLVSNKDKKMAKRLKKIERKKNLRQFVGILAKNSVAPALLSGRIFMPVNQFALAMMITNYLEHLSMKTSAFLRKGNSNTDVITPGEMAIYLFLCFCIHMKRLGGLNGTMLGAIPDTYKWNVPTPFAKWLQGLGSYKEVGFILTSIYTFSTDYVVGVNYPDSTSGTLPGPAFNVATNGSRAIKLMYQNPTAHNSDQEYFLAPDASSATDFVTFIGNRAIQVSRLIGDLNVAKIELENIPLYAPNGSAYGVPANEMQNGGGINNTFYSYVCDFNPEECMLYCGNNIATNALYNFQDTYTFPCYQMVDNTVDLDVNFYTQDYFINTFIMCWFYAIYKPGPILKITKYCNAHVTTLRYCPVLIDPTVIDDIITGIYRKIFLCQRNNSVANINQNPPGLPVNFGLDTTIPADSSYRVLTAFLTCGRMILLARFNQLALNFHCFDSVSCVQQYFADMSWLSPAMPATFWGAIMDVGPVVHCGMVYTPVFKPATPVLTVGGTNPCTASFITQGFQTSITAQNPNGPTYIFGCQWFANLTTDPDILLGGYNASALFPQSQQIQDLGAECSTYGINHYASDLLQMVNTLWSQFTTPPGFSAQLVHPHVPLCGSASTMLGTWYYTVNQQPGSTTVPQNLEYNVPQYVWPQHGTQDENTTYIVKNSYFLSEFYCLVQISQQQFARTITWPWSVSQVSSNTARFTRRLESLVRQSLYIDAVLDNTFNPDSTFSKALVIQEQKLRPVFSSVGPISVMLSNAKNLPECFWNEIFNEAITAVLPVASKAVNAAGMYLCSGNPVCGVAGEAIFNWILSNFNTQGNDVKPVSTKNKNYEKDARQVTSAISKIEIVD